MEIKNNFKELEYEELIKLFVPEDEIYEQDLNDIYNHIDTIELGYQNRKNQIKQEFLCTASKYRLEVEFFDKLPDDFKFFHYLIIKEYPEVDGDNSTYILCDYDESKKIWEDLATNKDSNLYQDIYDEIDEFKSKLIERNILKEDVDKLDIEYEYNYQKDILEFQIKYDNCLLFDNLKNLDINKIDNLSRSIDIVKNGYRDIKINGIKKEKDIDFKKYLIFDVEDENTKIDYEVDLSPYGQSSRKDTILIFKGNIKKIKKELDDWREYEESMNKSL